MFGVNLRLARRNQVGMPVKSWSIGLTETGVPNAKATIRKVKKSRVLRQTMLALAPNLAPDSGNQGHFQSFADRITTSEGPQEDDEEIVVSLSPDKRKQPLSPTDSDCQKSGRLDLNQRPLRPERSDLGLNTEKNAVFSLSLP